MDLPQNNKDLLAEINTYILNLPQPINQLFSIQLYKLYTNHKLDYTMDKVIAEFSASERNED